MTARDALWEEIVEQPEVLHRQLQAREQIAATAWALRQRGCEAVHLVAHGSSDNAATYAVYALRLLAGIPAARDSLSLPVYYHAPLRLDKAAVIGISQSGQTPDVVEYMQAARASGAATLAIANDPASPLADAAEFVLELHAGPQRALAATKTYTASLAVIALLGAALGGQLDALSRALAQLAASMPAAIASHQRDAPRVAALLAEYDRVFVTGRGLHYATSREIALKLTEIAHLLGCSHSATDLLHGPIAALQRPFPVWAIGGQDSTDTALQQALRRAQRANAPTILTAPVAACLSADYQLATPPAPTPLLGPLLAVLSGQIVAHATAQLRGVDSPLPAASHTSPATSRPA